MVSIVVDQRAANRTRRGLDKPTKHLFCVQNNQSIVTLNVFVYLSNDGIIFGYLLLRLFQVIRHFDFWRYISFAMHLDIYHLQIYDKINVSTKDKMSSKSRV